MVLKILREGIRSVGRAAKHLVKVVFKPPIKEWEREMLEDAELTKRQREHAYRYLAEKLSHLDEESVKRWLEEDKQIDLDYYRNEAISYRRDLYRLTGLMMAGGGTAIAAATIGGVAAGLPIILPVVIPAALWMGRYAINMRRYSRYNKRIAENRAKYIRILPAKALDANNFHKTVHYLAPILEHIDPEDAKYIAEIYTRCGAFCGHKKIVEKVANYLRSRADKREHYSRLAEVYRDVMMRHGGPSYAAVETYDYHYLVSKARAIEKEIKAALSSQETESSAS